VSAEDDIKPNSSDYLKYANLQMAAEAFLKVGNVESYSDDALVKALVLGNKHNSKFTELQAGDFAAHWKALDQEANTAAGFSGTLFVCILDDPLTGAKTGERVISLRSTEFVDDAARDNEATNTLEVKEFGFAFGQINDMEAWFEKLKGDPAMLPPDQQISVTGYSLGGHLATAFNILHGGAATTSGEPLIKAGVRLRDVFMRRRISIDEASANSIDVLIAAEQRRDMVEPCVVNASPTSTAWRALL
jgi:hypothetical protein